MKLQRKIKLNSKSNLLLGTSKLVFSSSKIQIELVMQKLSIIELLCSTDVTKQAYPH